MKKSQRCINEEVVKMKILIEYEDLEDDLCRASDLELYIMQRYRGSCTIKMRKVHL